MNNQQANQDKDSKIQLETALLISLLVFVRGITKRIIKWRDELGQMYSIQNDRQQLQDILTKHYMRVQDRFSKQELNRLNIKLSGSDRNNLNNILHSKAALRSTQQAGYIIQTMQKRLEKAGIENVKDWEAAIIKHFKSVVINTETQSIAEESKHDTIGFAQFHSYLNQASAIISMWHTILDGRERQFHFDAHGQERPYGSKFFVGEELLRYPGDPVGRPDNIINCRCSLITRMIK